MPTITPNDVVSKLPVNELAASLETFLQPLTDRLPDARLPWRPDIVRVDTRAELPLRHASGSAQAITGHAT